MKKRVLFLCTLNAVRSAMAEYIAREAYPENEYVSAGLYEGPPDYLAIEAMQEIGIDMSKHRPKAFSDLKNKNFDVVICLTKESADEMKELLEKNKLEGDFWTDIPSPGMIRGNRIMQLFGYREIRDKLRAKLRSRFA